MKKYPWRLVGDGIDIKYYTYGYTFKQAKRKSEKYFIMHLESSGQINNHKKELKKKDNKRYRFDLNMWERKMFIGYYYFLHSCCGVKSKTTIFKYKPTQANYKGICVE